MKKQAHSAPCETLEKVMAVNGTQIAPQTCALNEHELSAFNEQELNMDIQPVYPIDTLLVQQLENLLDGERTLQARYLAIDSTSNTPELREAFSQELSTLRDRADRLYRLMNAMDHYGTYEPKLAASFTPALA